MATFVESVEITSAETSHRVGVLRLSLTGAIAAGAFFALCWAALFIPFGPATHAYIGLFTDAEMTSTVALFQGLCWSVVFGALVGGLTALVYNALAALD